MQGRAGLSLIAPAEGLVELQLVATAYGEGRPLKIWRGEQLLVSIDIPAAPRDQAVLLLLLLPPGSTDLVLESPAAKSPEGRSISLSIEGLKITPLATTPGYTPRAGSPPPMTIPAMNAPPCGT
jgi:hypothetical protein